MTKGDGHKAGALIGTQTLTSSLLLVGAIAGLVLLKSQVPVFGFDDTGPTARFFPRIVLGLLALIVLTRLILNRRRPDEPLGPVSGWIRVAATAIAIAVGLGLMPTIGFFAGAAMAGFATALAFGERRLLFSAGLTLAVAASVTYFARDWLNIPLP